MQSNKYLIVIAGPTASGKTSVGIELAKSFETDIVSADSRQFYKEMSIGTAKPSQSEMQGVKHHFIDSRSIQQNYTVGDYEKDVLKLLGDLFMEKDIIILLGGSGLFIRAVCEGLDDFPGVADEIIKKLELDFQTYGLSILQDKLRELDPEYAAKADMQNPHRLLRALSVIESSGKKFSYFLNKKNKQRNFKTIFIQLNHPRKELYNRINSRVDQMLELGLKTEAKSLYPARTLKALQTVGYQEWFEHFDGTITEAEAIDLIKRNTRRYAKRQMTWFRKRKHWLHSHPSQIPYLLKVIKFFKENNLIIDSGETEKKNNIGPKLFSIKIKTNENVLAETALTIFKNKSPAKSITISSKSNEEILYSILDHEIDYYLKNRRVNS